MKDARSAMGAPVPIPTRFGTEDVAPTSLQLYGAIAIAVLPVVAALLALLFGRDDGPEVKPPISLAAGIWSLADILTAFLPLARLYVNGRHFFGLVAISYAVTGLLTCPYVLVYPGLFRPALTLRGGQPSIQL